ncbi:lipopolysaccharide transport periplasmic protein LptA [Candidatus Pelagadaptatus aseana]|uniref:lipopolysaccharide transport periplasmic protein LptA n=1 Tax=Candidatus Pelagadaptatus aseana TaxID=3120508 RepID=UPI003C6F242B
MPTLALPSDREQPIHITSDQAERNENKGITTYQGDVVMTQGTLKILADKVVIHTIDNQVSEIVATGKPAHFHQKPAVDKQMVKASGSTIEYKLENEMLHLINNAKLIQDDGTTMTGDRINYDMKTSVVKAAGKTSNSRPKRIHMVIPPKSERQKATGE